MNTLCTHQLRSCDYKEDGCQFMGYTKELTKHYKDQAGYHTQLMKQTFKKVEQARLGHLNLKSEVEQFKMEMSLHPSVDETLLNKTGMHVFSHKLM